MSQNLLTAICIIGTAAVLFGIGVALILAICKRNDEDDAMRDDDDPA